MDHPLSSRVEDLERLVKQNLEAVQRLEKSIGELRSEFAEFRSELEKRHARVESLLL